MPVYFLNNSTLVLAENKLLTTVLTNLTHKAARTLGVDYVYIPYSAAKILGCEDGQIFLGEMIGPAFEKCKQILCSLETNENKFERLKQGQILERLQCEIQIGKSARSSFIFARLFYKLTDFLGVSGAAKAEKVLQQAIAFVAKEALENKKPILELLRPIKAEYLEKDPTLTGKLYKSHWYFLLIHKRIEQEQLKDLDNDQLNKIMRFLMKYAPEELARIRFNIEGIRVNLLDYLVYYRADVVNLSCLVERMDTLPKATLYKLFNDQTRDYNSLPHINDEFIRTRHELEGFSSLYRKITEIVFYLLVKNKEITADKFITLPDCIKILTIKAMCDEAPELLSELRFNMYGESLNIVDYLTFCNNEISPLLYLLEIIDLLPLQVRIKLMNGICSKENCSPEFKAIFQKSSTNKKFLIAREKIITFSLRLALERDNITVDYFKNEAEEITVLVIMYLAEHAPTKLSEIRFKHNDNSGNLLHYLICSERLKCVRFLLEIMDDLPEKVRYDLLAQSCNVSITGRSEFPNTAALYHYMYYADEYVNNPTTFIHPNLDNKNERDNPSFPRKISSKCAFKVNRGYERYIIKSTSELALSMAQMHNKYVFWPEGCSEPQTKNFYTVGHLFNFKDRDMFLNGAFTTA